MSVSGWFVERLSLDKFRAKYLGKPFPVHSTFFLGEIALFCFVVLVGTGLYLALFYEPSAQTITAGGPLPAAYASTLAIDSHPFGALMRRMHHWAAHLMIASVILHLLRVYFTASYRRPREVNWVLGLVLLGVTIAASFAGYLLPYDQFSVTATAIGYGIARSVPWVGSTLADFLFGGPFPSPGTVPRFFAYHVVWAPLVLSALVALHMVILLKQKHTEPRGRGRAARSRGGAVDPRDPAVARAGGADGRAVPHPRGDAGGARGLPAGAPVGLLRTAAADDARGEARLVPALGVRGAAPDPGRPELPLPRRHDRVGGDRRDAGAGPPDAGHPARAVARPRAVAGLLRRARGGIPAPPGAGARGPHAVPGAVAGRASARSWA